MSLKFFKYQGTGNDFVIIDNRNNSISFSQEEVALICNRRFGVGADGLILLQNHKELDFEMIYFNSDGKTSSMCGNGGRCIVAFAKKTGIIQEYTEFMAIDGPHHAKIEKDQVSLKMNDVEQVDCRREGDFFLNTGSPHYVRYVNDLNSFDVYQEGKKVRNSEEFRKEGTNVNFVEKVNDALFVRTYERGVEDETFSCGTGVTAAGLVAAFSETGKNNFKIKTLGGELNVSFKGSAQEGFTDIWLTGPAKFVFEGSIHVKGLY